MVRIPGMFKNFDDLEENLSLPELEILLSKAREVEHNGFRFAASLKGINLDANDNNETPEEAFERVKRKAQAMLAGKTEDEFELAEIGIGFEIED